MQAADEFKRAGVYRCCVYAVVFIKIRNSLICLAGRTVCICENTNFDLGTPTGVVCKCDANSELTVQACGVSVFAEGALKTKQN